ncbi:bifunctional metallophosphatase/5'-nucleotidase [Bacillus sp. FJAT-18017]|uniref:bifunctional metallophosphatase/5'-nucleotidase n=1 Tax=Bacillus sp. FJAT-18017 TaxID=1705566 RepID=UPI0006ADDB36|nr:bifunctional UDP-sugar hydrolase/5'-nucleotidase [Bacillus sp. FJAT-18017]
MKTTLSRVKYVCLTAILLISIFVPLQGPSAKAEGENPDGLVNLQLLGITDFHGYIQALNDTSNGTIPSPDGRLTVGGAAYMAAHLNELEKGHSNSIRLSVGDNFSGWPFEVAAFRDEPTIELLNKLGIEMTSAGNHELDETADYLTKYISRGKCFGKRGIDSCFEDSDGNQFAGAAFEHLSANIRDAKSGQLIMKPYTIKYIPDGKGGNLPVGFIGLTTVETILGTTSYQEGALIADPLVEAAEKYTAELKEKGVETIVAVVHEGGTQDGAGNYNTCLNPRGPVIDFAKAASSEIDAIFTGHWHAAFNCFIDDPDGNPRPVIEGSNHGRLISEFNLYIDPETKEAVREKTTSTNHPVTRDIEPDAEIERMVSYWVERGKERAAEHVVNITGDITRARNANGESTLANLAADAHYAAGRKAAQPAEFALTASSPNRGDLLFKKGSNEADSDGKVLFSEQWNAHGYANPVVVVTLTGRQIDQILEEQWVTQANGTVKFSPLAVSHNVRYTFDASKPVGQRVEPENVIINGKVLDPDKSYRVAALAYLIRGNDGYPTFKGYANPVRTEVDHWAFLSYLKSQKEIDPSTLVNRVTSIGN